MASRRGDLRRKRLRRSLRLGGQCGSVKHILNLRRQHVQRAGQRRDKNKRRDKQPDVKVQAAQQIE